MCRLTKREHICGHDSTIEDLCDEVYDDPGSLPGDCGNLVEIKDKRPNYCGHTCTYRRRRSGWICHKCHGPNLKLPACAINRCGHVVCLECKPLTRPSKHNATKKRYPKYKSIEHIKWTGMAKPHPPPPPPPVPVYHPSVGKWV
ncbi:hypothetical protein LY76DRAFT_231875 [Colletotrichum caudatum]|nr:hypothetical protein LY76DRAFT_231875 [Colletotrichum caudatum]